MLGKNSINIAFSAGCADLRCRLEDLYGNSFKQKNAGLIGVHLYQRIEYFMHIHLITNSFILNYFSVAL